MVAPQKIAVVVRQRGGGNLMMHTRGIVAHDVQEAAEEVVTIMGKFAVARGRGDVDGTGDNAPNFSYDRLQVAHGRFVAVYRLVNRVWVIAMAPSRTNPFVVGRVVDSATKALIRACQQTDVTREVLTKHWVEAYLLLGAVLSLRGANFEKAQVEAAAQYLTIAADTKDRKGKGSAPEPKRAAPAPSQGQARRKLTTMESLALNLTFPVPDEAQPSNLVATRQETPRDVSKPSPRGEVLPQEDSTGLAELGDLLSAQRGASQPKMPAVDPFAALDDLLLPEPSQPQSSQPSPSPSFDDPFAATADPFPAVSSNPFPAASPDPFTASPSDPFVTTSDAFPEPTPASLPAPAQQAKVPTQRAPIPQAFGSTDDWDASFLPQPTPPAPQPAPTSWGFGATALSPPQPAATFTPSEPFTAFPSPARASRPPAAPVESGPVLRLVETWMADFRASNLILATLSGEVQWAGGRPALPSSPSAKFKLLGPLYGNYAVELALRDARLSKERGPASPGTPVLKYRLPPVATGAPVMVRVTSGVQPGTGKLQGQDGVVIVLVEYAVSRELKSNVEGFVDVHVPEKLGVPSVARPRPEWSKQQCRLRWRLKGVAPGGVGVLKAAFGQNKGMDSLAAVGFVGGHKASAAASVRVELNLMGKAGSTLSGISLEQEASGTVGLKHMPSVCLWRAVVTAKP
ncbi:unnamed protein product [Ostreobium quekettii]|uniref:Uncharacterized protein n=1 Tax=Ostreobium quekettii TaxID=121088 RepID=A0A8S1IL54_9CHLO|nr:unnamed protein product [Ostreobium quekettii]|eukprot:evm.model.scf_878EXC.5 EVM.evm.TU.scf_878EXC.5   scf_878EXC:31887-38332(+)